MLFGNGRTASGDLLLWHARAPLDIVLAVLVELPRDLTQDLRHHLLAEVVHVIRDCLRGTKLTLRQIELPRCRGDLEQNACGECPVLAPIRRNTWDELSEQDIESLDPAENVVGFDRAS